MKRVCKKLIKEDLDFGCCIFEKYRDERGYLHNSNGPASIKYENNNGIKGRKLEESYYVVGSYRKSTQDNIMPAIIVYNKNSVSAMALFQDLDTHWKLGWRTIHLVDNEWRIKN